MPKDNFLIHITIYYQSAVNEVLWSCAVLSTLLASTTIKIISAALRAEDARGAPWAIKYVAYRCEKFWLG